MRDKVGMVMLATFAAIAVGLFWRSARLDAQLSGTTTTTVPQATCMPVTVVVAHHDGCLRVAKGMPHLDPGTPLELIVQEDRR